MGGRRTIAFVFTVAAALWGQAAFADTVFDSFHVTRYRFNPAPQVDPDSSALAFFKAGFGVRASFSLGPQSDGVDLLTEPIYVSVGSFSISIGAERKTVVEGDEVELRYGSRGLNHVGRLFIKQTASVFRFRLRATHLNLESPDQLTLQIGDDVGQIDLRSRTAVTPRAFIEGVVAARMPQAGATSALVRAACPEGTCRRTTDDKGRFAVESTPGERRLTIDGSSLGRDSLSRLVRPVAVRAGTNDIGLVVLPRVAGATGAWVPAGTQPSAIELGYPDDAADPDAIVTIAAGANVEFLSDEVAQRLSLSRLSVDMLPVAPPSAVAAASAYIAEPAGAHISPCADLSLRNPLPGLEDGSTIDIFTLDTTGTWVVSATGIVVDQGKRIRADGALCELSSFFVGCVAEPTTLEASVTFRGSKIARVPVFVQGRSTLSTASLHDEANVHLENVAAGCLGAANSLRAFAALPLGDGYLSGASAAVPTVAAGHTDLGEIALTLCGDGVVEGIEECDGADVREHTCQDFDYNEGAIGCTPTCVLDLGRCRTCGNGITDFGEECDVPDDSLCPGACRSDCTCPPVCGDGIRNQASERCDGSDDVLCPDQCDESCSCPESATTTTTLVPAECPVAFDLVPVSRALSRSEAAGFEIGFSGLGHDRDIAGGHAMRLQVVCDGESPPCGECAIEKLAGVDGRCADDPATVCDTIDAPDSQCGGGRCDAYALPPLHNMWGGGPSCFLERLSRDVSGSIHNETGAAALSLDVAADLYFGVSPTQPCPVCKRDAIPNDGVKEGRCAGGARDGEPCDANGIDPTFGNTSFDCLPGAAMLGSPAPIARHLDLSTEKESLPFATPCDFPLQDLSCPCATCAGDTRVACASEDDCTQAGTTGPCNRRGAGVMREPNVCEGDSCVDTGDGIHGRCATGPDETFCDGMLFAHGTAYLPCLHDEDCRATDDACGGDCGECTITQRRSCFLDPIETASFASPTYAVLSDVLCVAPGASAGLDQVAGLAGPERVTLDVRLRRVFAAALSEPRGRGRNRTGK